MFPVVEGVQFTVQEEVVVVKLPSVHGLPVTVGVDAVKVAMP